MTPPSSSIFSAGKTAVITGAASGIGRAAARRFARQGLNLVLFDRDEAALRTLAAELDGATVRTVTGDVSVFADLERLRDEAFLAFGAVHVLMNNAAIGGQGSDNWTGLEAWRRILDVNLWGVVHGVHAFTPALLDQGEPAVIINTGSKQGITNPPGVPAYGTSKAAVRAMTEQLAHGLRETTDQVTAHLLVPGWTFTGMTDAPDGRQPQGSWTAEQVVDRMIAGVEAGEFYIICPDGLVDPALDKARLAWSIGDLIESRPALSRWSPEWKDRFETFIREETQRQEAQARSPTSSAT